MLLDWILFLTYSNLFEIKGFVVVESFPILCHLVFTVYLQFC
jgi:hypothetical protein